MLLSIHPFDSEVSKNRPELSANGYDLRSKTKQTLFAFIFQSRILSRSPVLLSGTRRRLSIRAGGGAGERAGRSGGRETVSTRTDRARDRPSNRTTDTN